MRWIMTEDPLASSSVTSNGSSFIPVCGLKFLRINLCRSLKCFWRNDKQKTLRAMRTPDGEAEWIWRRVLNSSSRSALSPVPECDANSFHYSESKRGSRHHKCKLLAIQFYAQSFAFVSQTFSFPGDVFELDSFHHPSMQSTTERFNLLTRRHLKHSSADLKLVFRPSEDFPHFSTAQHATINSELPPKPLDFENTFHGKKIASEKFPERFCGLASRKLSYL